MYRYQIPGSTVSSNDKTNKELNRRIRAARVSFGVVCSITTQTKCKVYRAVVLKALLYKSETWTVYERQVKRLHAVMMRQIRSITNLTRKDTI